MTMRIYDKASWHIDANEPKKDVIKRFNELMQWCYNHNLLTEDGKEIIAIGIDDSISIHSLLFTPIGNKLLCWLFDLNQNPYAVTFEEMENELSKIHLL